jgi:hypothetical protein
VSLRRPCRILVTNGWGSSSLELSGRAILVPVWQDRLRLPGAPNAAQYRSGACRSAVCWLSHCREPGLGEPISPGHWLGIACKRFEIFVIGLTMQVYVRVATTRAETPMGGRSQGAVLKSNRKTLVSARLNQPVLISFSLATRILSLRIRRRAARIGRKSR